jgi:hypothetical protein
LPAVVDLSLSERFRNNHAVKSLLLILADIALPFLTLTITPSLHPFPPSPQQKICALASIDMAQVEHILHGTTVATNAVLEGKGVKVGLITTEGYRQILHIDRSFVPGVSRGGREGGREGGRNK